jgi:hypothetical protein
MPGRHDPTAGDSWRGSRAAGPDPRLRRRPDTTQPLGGRQGALQGHAEGCVGWPSLRSLQETSNQKGFLISGSRAPLKAAGPG